MNDEDNIMLPPGEDCPQEGHPAWAYYRKKPVVIRAYQTPFADDIVTLEGVMRAQPGDFIIEGVAGEIYPCRADIFRATYEEA